MCCKYDGDHAIRLRSDKEKNMRLILASASPRRRELLQQIQMEFTVLPAKGEEKITKEVPQEVVMELSEQKAREVAGRPDVMEGDALVLGADTVVVYQDKILGKPKDEQDALAMLKTLAGNTHEVYTGVTLLDVRTGKSSSFFERTAVTMFSVQEEEILEYIATGEPMDKAGAYGIQGIGAKFIKCIEGDYNNVVGLPVGRVYQEIKGKYIEMP